MGPSKPRTAADDRRFDAMKELGCIVTRIFFPERLERYGNQPGEIHHILVGGRRPDDEHQHTICWLPWYHRGVPPEHKIAGKVRQLTNAEATQAFGPSWHLNKRAFEKRFAPEQTLLEYQNAVLATYWECVNV